MTTPGTFAFMLRWFPFQTIGGALLAGWAGYTLWTYAPIFEADAPLVAGLDIFGPPFYWLSLVAGVVALGYAWWGASRLRNGG